jgi:hypothetical protein
MQEMMHRSNPKDGVPEPLVGNFETRRLDLRLYPPGVKLSNTFGLIIEADRPRLVRDAVKQFEAASALTRW